MYFKDDSGQEPIDDDDPVAIINPTTSTTNNKDDETAKSGCRSIIVAVPLSIFVIIGFAVILILKKAFYWVREAKRWKELLI